MSTISVACVQEYLSRWYRWWTGTVLTVVAVAVLAGGTSFYGRATRGGTAGHAGGLLTAAGLAACGLDPRASRSRGRCET